VARTADEESALLALLYDDQRFAPPGVSFATTRERDGPLARSDDFGVYRLDKVLPADAGQRRQRD
jgi:hypothetical protein